MNSLYKSLKWSILGIAMSCTKSSDPTPTPTLIDIINEIPGLNCVNGGIKISTGADSNLNRTLDINEITSTKYVCNGLNGANGINGLNSLVTTSTIAPGALCPNGGIKIDSGLDTSKDGVLNTSEIQSTMTICNGINGVNGLNGLNSLVSISTILPGTLCPNGGTKIDSGLDSNKDGILNASEIQSTMTLCNGVSGPTVPGNSSCFPSLFTQTSGASPSSQTLSYTLSFVYDSRLKLSEIRKDYVGSGTFSTLTYTYDNMGNLSAITTLGWKRVYTYDVNNQLVTEDYLTPNPIFSFRILYSYNLTGQLTTLTYGNYYVTTFEYPNTVTRNPSKAVAVSGFSDIVFSYLFEYDNKLNPDNIGLYTEDENMIQPWNTPGLKTDNNIVKWTVISDQFTTPGVYTYTYQYNTYGYPTLRTASSGEVTAWTYGCK